jgi:hypothetical protein
MNVAINHYKSTGWQGDCGSNGVIGDEQYFWKHCINVAPAGVMNVIFSTTVKSREKASNPLK